MLELNLNHNTGFNTGDALSADNWNKLAEDVNTIGAAINNGDIGGNNNSSSNLDSYMYINDKGNFCIETTDENVPSGKKGKINIESKDDLQLKPGDDIVLCAHHRGDGNTDQVLLKSVTEIKKYNEDNNEYKDEDVPAKLKINTGDITITNADCIGIVMVEIKTSKKKANEVDYIIESNTDPLADTFSEQNNFYSVSGVYLNSVISSKLSNSIGQNAALDVNNSNPNTYVSGSTIATDIINSGIGKTRWIKWTDGAAQNPSVKFYKFTKAANADGVTNINIEDSSGFGYLKVRAQSIDLRCEEHGGIALQPKGYDGDSHMNKIKFEHGGGDGLEFGTFNTEHTSLFTTDYRFNKAGVIKLATRSTQLSDKYDGSDETTHYKYVKQNDDLYDEINANDPTCTWADVVTIISELKTMRDNQQGPWQQL